MSVIRGICRWCFIAVLALSAGGAPSRAEEPRPFVGFCEITNLVNGPSETSFTLTVTLLNRSGSDVTNGRLIIVDSLRSHIDLGSLGPFDVTDESNVLSTGQFSIPAREYDGWIDGMPFLSFEFVDGTGEVVRRPVEVLLVPATEGN